MSIRPSIIEWFVILAIFGVFGSFAVDGFFAYRGSRDGALQAEADLAAGSFRLQWGGYKSRRYEADFVRLCQVRHGIEITIDHSHGCCPTSYQGQFAKAYNERVLSQIAVVGPTFSHAKLLDDARKKKTATEGLKIPGEAEEDGDNAAQQMGPRVKRSAERRSKGIEPDVP